KSVHRFLVGRVRDRRPATPALPELGGQARGEKRLVVERFEGPILYTGPVQGGPCLRYAVGGSHPPGDGDGHAGWAGLGQGGTVHVLDHRVHDRLGVHDHVDAVEGYVEEQVGLDDLQPLVDQRRGVDRDDRPHAPRRVLEGLGRGHVDEFGPGTSPEGPAAGGDDQAAYLVPVRADKSLRGPALLPLRAREALSDGEVFGVDGDDLPGCGQITHQGTTDDQGFLVGKGQATSGTQRGQRGFQAQRTGDAVEHHVTFRAGELGHTLGTGQHLGRGAVLTEGTARFPCFSGVGDGNLFHAEFGRLFGEQVDLTAARGQPRDPKTPRVALHDVEGLSTDGAGRPENHYFSLLFFSHGFIVL